MCLFCDANTSSRLNYRAAGKARSVSERLDGPPDIVLRGATILTMDKELPSADALALRDGLVQFVGDFHSIVALKGRFTRVIDMEGRVVTPGFVWAAMRKDPVDMLDWQRVDLDMANGDLAGVLERSVSPPLFSEPVFIESMQTSSPSSWDAVWLQALADRCGKVPIAVRVSGSASGVVNQTMLALAPAAALPGAEHIHGCDFRVVPDIGALLAPIAARTLHSVPALARAFEKTVAEASAQGFTTVVDPAMGSLAGRDEILAVTSVLAGRRRIRVSALAQKRLREEWDGRIAAELQPGLLNIHGAIVDLEQPLAELRDEVGSLDRAGWPIVFDVKTRPQIGKLVEICNSLGLAGSRRGNVDLEFEPESADVDLLARNGFGGAIERLRERNLPAGSPSDGQEGSSGRLPSLTERAARHCGLDHVCGVMRAGRRADLAVLERFPSGNEPLHVAETWMDGIPVQ